MLQIRDFTKSREAEIEYVKLSKKLRLCKSDDILIGRYGASVGKILTGLEGAYNVAIIKSIPDEGQILKRYIRRYFESCSFQQLLQKVCVVRTAQAGFAKDDIKDTLIPLPPLSEQSWIVSRLDAAFGEIEGLKAKAEAQLREARTLFQAALTQEMKPKQGWEEKKIVDVAEYRGGTAHESVIADDGCYVVINSKFVSTEGRIKKYSNIQLSPLYKDDIVMVLSDVPRGKTLAKCYIVECNGLYTLNQRICAFKSKGIHIKFLYYMLNRNPHLLSYDNGENQTNLRTKNVTECPVYYPKDYSTQQQIVSRLDALSEKVRELEEAQKKVIAECDALKQALLREVFE